MASHNRDDPNRNIKYSFLWGSIGTFSTRLLVIASQVAAAMIVARVLGPDGRGISAAAIMYCSLFFTLGYLSLEIAYIHHFNDKSYSIEDFAGNSLVFCCVLGTLLILAFLVSYYLWHNDIYKNIEIKYLLLSFSALPFLLFVRYFSTIVQCLNQIRKYNYIAIIEKMVYFAGVVTLATIQKLDVANVIAVYLIGTSVAALLAAHFVKELSRKRWSINFDLMKVCLRDAVKFHIGSIAVFLYTKIDVLMINNYLGERDTGYYVIAVAISELLLQLPWAVQAVLNPRVATLSDKQAEQFTVTVVKNTFLLTLLSSIGLILLSNWLVLVYAGSEYYPQAVLPLRIISIGIVFLSFPISLSALWIKRGIFTTITCISTSSAILNITLNVILIPWGGISGAALATLVTYFAVFISNIVLVKLFTNLKVSRLFILTREDIEYYRNLANHIFMMRKSNY